MKFILIASVLLILGLFFGKNILISNYLKAVQKSLRMVYESSNIETVMKNWRDGLAAAQKLKKLEQMHLYRAQPTADKLLYQFTEQKDALMMDAVRRSYQKMLEKSETELKTEKGKLNRQKKFFELLSSYDFGTKTEKYIDSLQMETTGLNG